MIKTPICDLLHIEHPVALGGMGSGTSPELVSAVSNAGGLGALGCHGSTPPSRSSSVPSASSGRPINHSV